MPRAAFPTCRGVARVPCAAPAPARCTGHGRCLRRRHRRSRNRRDRRIAACASPSDDGVTDGLELGVLIEPGVAVLAADAAGLVAAERYVGPVGCGAVDTDEAGAQPP